MTKRLTTTALTISLLLVGSSCISYAAKAKPKPKPAPKAPAKPAATTHHETIGTTQLKGEWADIGSTYTVGKDDPWNFRLISAEYSVAPITIGETTFAPTADEKLLILRLMFHNPRPAESFLRWDSLSYTIVDSQDQNHEGLLELGKIDAKIDAKPGDRIADKVDGSAPVAMTVKPAQRVDGFGVMRVPANGEMPKFIVKGNDGLVLRYDLRGKVMGLPTTYADPADKTGATALKEIKAEIGKPYYMEMFNVTVTGKGEYSSATELSESTVEEGERFFILPITLKSLNAVEEFLRWDTFEVHFLDADGIELATPCDMLQASKDKGISMGLPRGKELSVRLLAKVPSDSDVKTVTMKRNEGRTFVFEVGQ